MEIAKHFGLLLQNFRSNDIVIGTVNNHLIDL